MKKNLEIELAGNFLLSLDDKDYRKIEESFLVYKIYVNSLKKYKLFYDEKLFIQLEIKYNQFLEGDLK